MSATSTQYAQFGLNGDYDCGNSADWMPNALLSFSQTGGQLVVSSYTNSSGKDQNTPVATTVFTVTTQ